MTLLRTWGKRASAWHTRVLQAIILILVAGGDEMVVDGGMVDGVMVNGASLSLSAGEGSSHVVKGGGGRW